MAARRKRRVAEPTPERAKVILVGHRGNTNMERQGKLRPFDDSASGRFLDEVAPSWRTLPATNLLWTITDDADPVKRAEWVMRYYQPKLVIACGREVAKAFGVDAPKWFTAYKLSDDQPLILTIPHPSPRNRMWNDPANRERLRVLFDDLERLLNDLPDPNKRRRYHRRDNPLTRRREPGPPTA